MTRPPSFPARPGKKTWARTPAPPPAGKCRAPRAIPSPAIPSRPGKEGMDSGYGISVLRV